MRHTTEDNPVSQEDLIDHCEREMRECLAEARKWFEDAKWLSDQLDASDEAKIELWNKFNATERRLMKDKEGKEWS